MENQDINNCISGVDKSKVKKSNTLFLPILGLVLDLMIYIFFILVIIISTIFDIYIDGETFLVSIVLIFSMYVAPLTGFILGIVTLKRGKKVNGELGTVIGVLDIIIPIFNIAFVLLSFIVYSRLSMAIQM